MGAFWEGKTGDDEAQPMMQPVRMELAPHVRLGRRVNVTVAIMILLVFHTTLLVAGSLNWNVPCEYQLSRFLVLYGAVGLSFVYLLVREWLFYSRLGSWPSTTSFLLLCVFYAALSGAGVVLTIYTIRSRDSCRLSAPLLYRWCFAAALFFVILSVLVLFVPVVRIVSRCVLAPVALCLIGCVETVGMDVDVGPVGEGFMKDDSGRRRTAQKEFIPAALMSCMGVLCAPCYFVYSATLGLVCRPVSVFLFKLCETVGCVRMLPNGNIEFRNCFNECTCGWMVRHCTQCLMAPGCLTPGRSIVGLFVNTSALLWFFVYLLFELYWNWNLLCDNAVPDADHANNWFEWLKVLSPSPVHWLILVFAVSGVVITLFYFIHDLFSTPRAPPRSAYEVHKWKMRRQLRVCANIFLFFLFCTWGALLLYFVCSQQSCANSSPGIYRLAWLLLLVFFVFAGLAVILFFCVCIDCCISGRLRFVLLLTNGPNRDASSGESSTYGSSKPANTCSAGAVDKPAQRLAPGPGRRSSWQNGEAAGRLLPEEVV